MQSEEYFSESFTATSLCDCCYVKGGLITLLGRVKCVTVNENRPLYQASQISVRHIRLVCRRYKKQRKECCSKEILYMLVNVHSK